MVNEPNFEGEVMKIPSENFSVAAAVESPKTQFGLILILSVALLAILAGLFYWYQISNNVPVATPAPMRPSVEQNAEPETPTATAQTESFGAMSTSDEITALEADIDSTNLDSLDSELGQIDATLEAQ
jgi:hypothetical protein